MLEYADEWGVVLCECGIGTAGVGAFCCVDHGYVVNIDVRVGLSSLGWSNWLGQVTAAPSGESLSFL